jgi:hypothetical protein
MAMKRVRVAVWIDSEGDYFASGGSRFNERNSAEDDARECYENDMGRDGVTLYWIEADVPIPETPVPETIEGKVTT